MDKSKIVNRMIVASSIMLILCCAFKLFSNGLFEIAVKDAGFIAFTSYIDSKIWLQWLVALPFSLISNTLLLLAIIGEHKKKHIISVILFSFLNLVLKFISVYFIPLHASSINLLLDTLLIICLPYYFNKNLINCLNGYLINLGFQSFSLLIRNIGIKVILIDSLSSIILSVDIILMYIIYFLYTNFKKGGVEK